MKGKVKNMYTTKTNDRRRDNYGGAYKVVEAMYLYADSSGKLTLDEAGEEIIRCIRDTDESTIWDMIQRVFALDQMRKERS